MSCGSPHDVPCSEVLERVHPYLDGRLDETATGRSGRQVTTRVFKQPVQAPRSPSGLNMKAVGTPTPPRTVARTVPCPSTRSSPTTNGSSSLAGRLLIRAVRRGRHSRRAPPTIWSANG
jgi:hypothetical protein